jgi:uncharacterized phiE125 gp8 family phage protein
MIFKLTSGPAVEPVSTSDMKTHLRVDSTTFAASMTETQSIAPKTWPVTASYGIEGAGVSVVGYDALVVLNVGTCAGTLDSKIQESDDDSTYVDWSGGAFTQRTAANDETTQEIEYTGTANYVRVVGQVAADTCGFSAIVVNRTSTHAEDTYISGLITAARKYVESITGLALITQTWEGYLQDWPREDYIEIERRPLQSVTSVVYTDSDDSDTTWSTDYYTVNTVYTRGRITLGYGYNWPTVTLAPDRPIKITFVAGFGDASTDVPDEIIHAIKLLVSNWYENREPVFTSNQLMHTLPMAFDALLAEYTDYVH